MKLYQIFNYLFGWDYILWQDACYKGVSKIRILPNGKPYYLKYGSVRCFEYITEDNCGSTIVGAWLTCEPSKYLTNPPT